MTNEQYWYIHAAAMEMQRGTLGGFTEAIGKAMIKADMNNLAKLAEAFPDLIAYAHEDIANREARKAIATAQGETA